jgi:hypothetical protein
MFLIPWVAGASVATVLASTVLTLPAVVALRAVIARRLAAPLERGPVERNLVLLSAVVGGAGAVAWSELFGFEFATILLGFVAPVPLACVSWFSGEALSGSSHHPWRALVSAAAAASIVSWTTYVLCWSHGAHLRTAGTLLIELACSMLASVAAANSYLATRGPPLAAVPEERVLLDRL